MSINERLQADVKALEIHVWRALRESGPAVFEFATDDCTFAIDGKVLDEDSEPTFKEYMENTFKPWTTYEMHDLRVVEIGLMAATTVYKVTASRLISDNKPPKKSTLLCSSSWAQGADAEWRLKVHAEGIVKN
jgi:ketosteroid isomerase-like protein